MAATTTRRRGTGTGNNNNNVVVGGGGSKRNGPLTFLAVVAFAPLAAAILAARLLADASPSPPPKPEHAEAEADEPAESPPSWWQPSSFSLYWRHAGGIPREEGSTARGYARGSDSDDGSDDRSDLASDPVCLDLMELFRGRASGDGSEAAEEEKVVFCDVGAYAAEVGFDLGNPECESGESSPFHRRFRAVVRPRNAQDVSKVVGYVAKERRRRRRSQRQLEESNGGDYYQQHPPPPLSLTVRGGGHSYTCNSVRQPAAGSGSKSIHLDLRSLNRVEVVPNSIDDDRSGNEDDKENENDDDESELLRMGSGITFEDAFRVVDRDTYSFVHGECASVGVGGYYLHGGTHGGALSNLYGFGNETVRSLEVVIADGSVLRFTEPRRRVVDGGGEGPRRYVRYPVQVVNVTASPPVAVEEGYEGLWDAIRTAGSSFGIVTEITVQLWRGKPEPMTWFLNLPLTQRQVFQLLDDARLDPSVQVNAGDSGHVRVPLRSLFQISLVDGPRDPVENRRACVDWLKAWLDANGIWWLRWRWSRRFFEAFTDRGLRIVSGNDDGSAAAAPAQNGRLDLGTLYPSSGGWVTSSVWVPWSSPHRERLAGWYRDKALSLFPGQYWLALVPFDRRRHAGANGDDFVLFIEFTAWPADRYRDWMRDLERELEREFPPEVLHRYYNVPIAMETDEEDERMVRRYFPHLDVLRAFKARYDPENLFSPYQGITPAVRSDEGGTAFAAPGRTDTGLMRSTLGELAHA